MGQGLENERVLKRKRCWFNKNLEARVEVTRV
jgi:hypothetical protein